VKSDIQLSGGISLIAELGF